MRTKVIAALLAVLTALGGLNLFQSIKQKLVTGDEAQVEAIVVTEKDGITVHEEGNRIVIRASSASESELEIEEEFDFEFDFDFDFDFDKEAVDFERSGAEEVMIDETFNVREGATLIADVTHADFKIVTGSGSEARVEVIIDSRRRMDRAKEVFEEMNWRVTQEDGDIVILADEIRRWNNINLDIDVVVHIPSRFNIDMESSHGDIFLGDIEGEVSIVTSHGDVEMANATSNRIWVKSSHGDIEGGVLKAGIVELQTSHADIEFAGIESTEFKASTSHADVEIGKLYGAARIRTSHGDVNVELADAEGADIETQHGDVDIYIASKAGLDLDLRGGEVEVGSGLNLNGRVSEKEARGEVNGGGALLRVRTTHGEISVL